MRVRSFLFLLVLAPTAWTQTQDLEEVTVTATRVETSLANVPRSVTVIETQQIQRATQLLGLDESLSSVPGLYVQGRYNFAQDLRIAIRGFGARSNFGIRGIRIYVDDIPESLPDGQAQVDSIDLGSASRVEVLRGPSSTLYGNAAGGVIAITSEAGSDPGFVSTSVSAGELGYARYQAKLSGSEGKFGYLLNLSRYESDGFRDHSQATGNLVNGRFNYQISETDRLDISLNLNRQPFSQDPGGINEVQASLDPGSAREQNVTFDAGESLNQERIGLAYRRESENGRFLARAYSVWRDFDNRLPFTGGGAVSLGRRFSGFGLQYGRENVAVAGLDVNIGFDVDDQRDDRRRFDNLQGELGDLVFNQQEDVTSLGGFLQSRYAIAENLFVEAGLRFDRIEFDVTDQFLADGDQSGDISFSQTSPSIGFGYGVSDQLQLFGNISRSFETPTTTELANPAGGGFNPDLDSQTANSYEIGLRGQTGAFSFETTAFVIDINNELIPFELADMPDRTFFTNAGESTRHGLELGLSWRRGGFFGNLNYTVSDFEFDSFVTDSGNDFSGNELPGLPSGFGRLDIGYSGEQGLYAVFENLYSGSLKANNSNTVTVDSYWLSNLRLSYRFGESSWDLEPSFGINNLFSESYNNNIRINAFGGRFFEPAPRRNLYAGVSFTYRFGS